MTHDQPACQMVLFPMVNRIGKIRHVAAKMLTMTTRREAEIYYKQVNAGIRRHFDHIGLSEAEQRGQLRMFWNVVWREWSRLRSDQRHGSNGPRGAA